MSIEEKLQNAKPTTWATDGFTDEEVDKIVTDAKNKLGFSTNWIWYQERYPSFYDPFPDDWGECGWRCQFCGVFANDYGYDEEHIYPPEHLKYCPNCGKKMFVCKSDIDEVMR